LRATGREDTLAERDGFKQSVCPGERVGAIREWDGGEGFVVDLVGDTNLAGKERG
jgi:hypothetical protein